MKTWWKTFFKPITADVMFKPRTGKQTKLEVDMILKAIKKNGRLKILDLCCGEGRHSVQFAKKHNVVGLDYSKDFLKVAKSKIGKSERLKFIHGDMKLTSKYFSNESFDLAVSLFNSFGYFDKRSDDLKVLKEVNKVLKLGGIFVINTLNGSGVKTRLGDKKPTHLGYETERNVFMLDHAYFDEKKMRTFANWTIIDARKSKTQIFRSKFGQNVYLHSELKSMLQKSGFKIVKTWGILSGEKFNEKKSWHQTIVAMKVK
jgi:ubiquinone/menaquinone biosynthesis C-methylase UbiE